MVPPHTHKEERWQALEVEDRQGLYLLHVTEAAEGLALEAVARQLVWAVWCSVLSVALS